MAHAPPNPIIIPVNPGPNPITLQDYQDAQNDVRAFNPVGARAQTLATHVTNLRIISDYEAHDRLVNNYQQALNLHHAFDALILAWPAPGAPGPQGPQGLPGAAQQQVHIAAVKYPVPKSFGGEQAEARPFIQSLLLYFGHHGNSFTTDVAKVRFTLSLLTGRALQWASPLQRSLIDNLTNQTPLPRNCTDWATFEAEFRATFYDPDEMRSARSEMAKLVHQKSVAEYTARWRELVAQLGWTDQHMLMANYQEGLKERVKAALMMLENDPADLEALIRQAIRIDAAQYIDLKADQGGYNNSKKGPTTQKQKTQTKETTYSYTANDQGGWDSTSKGQSGGQYSKVKQEQVNSARGPLSPEEKEKRFKLGLCLYCGQKGHRANQCPEKRGNSRINALEAEIAELRGARSSSQPPITAYFQAPTATSSAGQYAQRAPLPPNEAFHNEDF